MSFDPDQSDPTKLADALRAAYTHRTAVPPSIEASILSTAHQAFEARRRRRMTLRWATGLAASLAAAIALALILHHPTTTLTTPTQVAKSTVKGDLNADGRVDMTDALLLAKHVAARDNPEPTWDANCDGVVDQKDVDALAATAVSLKQPGLARAALPKFEDLGLDHLHVGSASADVSSHPTFAKAIPAEDRMEAPR